MQINTRKRTLTIYEVHPPMQLPSEARGIGKSFVLVYFLAFNAVGEASGYDHGSLVLLSTPDELHPHCKDSHVTTIAFESQSPNPHSQPELRLACLESSTAMRSEPRGRKSRNQLSADKATRGRVLPSRKIAISLRSGFLHAGGGANNTASTKVLFEIPNKIAPHSAVDTDSL